MAKVRHVGRPTTLDAYKFFHKGTLALSRMESAGIKIDTDYLDKTIKEVGSTIKSLQESLKADEVYRKWRRRYGSNMNLDSTQQLATVLFKVMGYKATEFTESTSHLDEEYRTPKTDENALRNIDLPFIKEYFKVKKYKKVLGTYLKGIRREVCDGFLHPSYNLAGGFTDDKKGGAASYRGSSSNPNFQNIPKRNKVMEKLIRPAFVARWQLVEIDFSGIEVRIAACYNKDPNLIRYIKDKTTDMHRDEACELFHIPAEYMAKYKDYFKGTARDAAKNMWVFPQFYGSVWFQCAPPIWEAMKRREFKYGPEGESLRKHLRKHGINRLGKCDPEQGEPEPDSFAYHLQQCEKKLWTKRFPVYTQWKKDFYNKYLERGHFDLYTGFRCQGYFRRNQVINFPVQGAAFHCLLWSIIRIQEELKKRNMRALLVGQIHDSLISDVPPEEMQEFLSVVKDVMTRQLPEHWSWINIPIEVEVDVSDVGASWLDKKEWVENNGVWAAKA